MKGHKAHHHAHKAKGGSTGGVDEAMEDLEHNPEMRVHAPEIEHEAEEKEGKKHGGRAKRKRGGHVMHHHMGHVKHVGHADGEAHKHHAGRKPRKAGGKVGSESHPFSSALHGTPAKGRKLEKETMGMDE